MPVKAAIQSLGPLSLWERARVRVGVWAHTSLPVIPPRAGMLTLPKERNPRFPSPVGEGQGEREGEPAQCSAPTACGWYRTEYARSRITSALTVASINSAEAAPHARS